MFPPIIQDQDEMHSVWINQLLLSRDRSEEAKEWALAHFALDNLVHRACHLAKRARQLRTSVMYTTSYEASLQQEIISLQNRQDSLYKEQNSRKCYLMTAKSELQRRQIRFSTTHPSL